MPARWFVPMGWLHRPVSVIGWLLTLAALAFMAQVFIAVDARSHPASDTLYGIFPFWGVTWLAWDWIARRNARPPGSRNPPTGAWRPVGVVVQILRNVQQQRSRSHPSAACGLCFGCHPERGEGSFVKGASFLE